MLRFKYLLVVLFLAWSFAAVAQAEMINIPVPNGDFSSPEIVAPNTYVLTVPTDWSCYQQGSLTGLAVGGMNGASDQYFFPGIAKNGDVFLYQPTISGTSFVEGDTYTLDFDYANGQTNPYTLKASIVYAGGTAIDTATYEVDATQGWTHGSVSSVATSATTGAIGIVFEFQTPNVTGNYQPWLDHVTLTQQTVPEPGTLMLLTTGLIGLLAYAWRKRK